MFKKLKSYHSVPDWTRLKGEPISSYGCVHLFNILDKEYLKSFFHDVVDFNIPPAVISYVEITGSIIPHIDPKPITGVLNFVIESADATTTFWIKKSDDIKEGKVDQVNFSDINKNDAPVFSENDLTKYGEVRSYSGDFIFMDSSKIHSVDMNNNLIRRMVSWKWVTIDYNLLSKNIKLLF